MHDAIWASVWVMWQRFQSSYPHQKKSRRAAFSFYVYNFGLFNYAAYVMRKCVRQRKESNMEYAFKFTVISAVYKVEPFLREAIDSLIVQDIGFEHVQLILVDDGSPDNCGAICDEYAARYPKNIQVIHKENGGVSSARNVGLMHAKGRFVNFMDSDDKLSPETLREVYQFFMQHLDEIDIASVPLQFFDGRTGAHPLNYKYNRGNRIIDMDREWMSPQMHVSSSFIKKECLEGLQFDTRLAYAEDALMVHRVLLNKCALGVVATGKYLYRRRSEGEQSAIQTSGMRKNWYLPCLKYFHIQLLDMYLEKYGYVPRFVQYAVMYDLQWRVQQEQIPQNVLSEEEVKEYREMMVAVIRRLDDEVILSQRNIGTEIRLFVLNKKYGRLPEKVRRDNDVVLRFERDVSIKLSDCNCRLEFVQLGKDYCVLEGNVPLFPVGIEQVEVTAICNGKSYVCEYTPGRCARVASGETVLKFIGFRVRLPLMDSAAKHEITFVVTAEGMPVPVKRFFFGAFFPIGSEYKSAYYYRNDWSLTVDGKRLLIEKTSTSLRRKKENAFCHELWIKKRRQTRKAVFARTLARILKCFHRRPLWLITDRVIKAGDNGEAFFRYLREHHHEIDARFVIGKDSQDYATMRKIGPVLAKDSAKHKLYYLMCDYIISSQGELDIYNPFRKHSAPYRDIMANIRFVFLQHGVILHDLASWLNRYNKNLHGFITSAEPEYRSILESDYAYEERQVWLTGLPRFDRLYHAEEKCITVMPTWRKYLMGSWNDKQNAWTLAPSFAASEYLDFYNRLFNHERLLTAAKEYGYRIDFMPHPIVQPHVSYFQCADQVNVLGAETQYRDIYARSELVITDYSSAIFDFAYLRKPIVYTHFDAETFFGGNHTCKMGYFDYERDGFGEVTRDLESTVDCIIEYMKNGCQLKDIYRERIDRFFAFDDQNNCQRVYDRIMELEKET